VFSVQTIPTLVTPAVLTEPEPAFTTQVWPVGWIATVTRKLEPEATGANVNAALELSVKESPPLLLRITDLPAARPDTIPHTE
jgi:hypothetical protein